MSPRIRKISLVFLLALTVGCSEHLASLKEDNLQALDPVQKACTTSTLIPNRNEWAIRLATWPDCIGPHPEGVAKEVFDLGMASFPYASIASKYGAADGAKENQRLSPQKKKELEEDSVAALTGALLAKDRLVTEYVQNNPIPCIHSHSQARVFSSGYTCAYSNATKASDPYAEQFVTLCSMGCDEKELAAETTRCKVLAKSALAKRIAKDTDK